uniref:Sterol-4-alpha-carboxylate 3-dehydrogenase, decarboxylating n=1 Tax=Hirondellea gigas TaxID=1518452 RepID=A0A2P2I4D0_9CRUS
MSGPLSDEAMSKLAALNGKNVLVTGGCGFLGRHLVELLLDCGANVRVFDLFITEYSEDVEFVKGNLLNLSEVEAATKGCWAVFHVASPSPTSGNAKLFFSVNVDGTQNVIDACRSQNVGRLVYTSSASIVFDGTDQKNFDESAPFPLKSLDAYTKSKLAAEQLALKDCAPSNPLAVCAMRPHSIFGPRDPHFVPSLARAGREGKSRYIIGNGENIVDFTYVGNVTYAHALAAVHLSPDSKVNGEAYFITNDEPVKFWDFVSDVQVSLGFTKPWLKLPYLLMYAMAYLLSFITAVFPSFRPVFNLQSVSYAGCHHYYTCAKAKDHFGYVPAVSLKEAKRRNLEHFEYLHASKPPPLK